MGSPSRPRVAFLGPVRPEDTTRLVGVVHLLPLPGAPRPGPGLDAVLRRAQQDARALAEGGADGVIVENLGDAPFAAGRVPAVTVAAMTRAAMAVREAAPTLPLGLNVLRNDGEGALAVAAATDARFVRVNVLSGVMATDQGLVQGTARSVLLARRMLGVDVAVVGDVLVKHAHPVGLPGPADGGRARLLEDLARDTFARGGADALIVSGRGTGQPTAPEDVARVRRAVPGAPVWLGSGLTPGGAAEGVDLLDVAIVGTWLHEDADLSRPLDAARVARMREALHQAARRAGGNSGS